MDDKRSLIPEEDLAYEQEQARLREEERLAEEERIRREEEYRRSHAKSLNADKIELMKLKQGIIESSDTVKEEQKVEYKLSFVEWLSNVWYRNKWLILFIAALVVSFSYIIYDQASRTKPDMTVLVVYKNMGIYYRTEELSDFLGRYCDDLNGDGEVYVEIFNISTDYSNAETATASQAQLMSQLQSGTNIMVISDHETDFLLHDFTQDHPDDERFTSLGIKLNCQVVRDALKWEAMDDSFYIGMREPAQLFSASKEDMEENYNEAMIVFNRLAEEIANSPK